MLTPKDLLISYNIKIERESSTHIVCRCLNPHHNDSNPSFSIRKADGYFKCFGCKLQGGYKKLYWLVTGEGLTGEDNVSLTWNRNIHKVEKRKELPEIVTIGTLQDPLKNKDIRKFLYNNGIYSDDFIKDYDISYSVYTEMIAKHLINVPNMKYTGMTNRICTPIVKENKLINVEGRIYNKIEELPEGTPKVLYVKGGSVEHLYNWENIDKTKPVVTTESVKNFWKIWNVYPNTVALFHAIPSEYQLTLLEEVDIIHFGDNDEGFFGKYVEGQIVRKGTLQALAESYSKDFKICYDKRKHPNGKGYDANDCTLEEIKNHINKAIYYSDYIDRKPKRIIKNW